MGKFSKIFHHIESKDLRNKHEQKKAAKIQEEKKEEEFKQYLVSTMEKKRYSWREGMTTSDVSTISVEKLPGDGDVTSVDTIDSASYEGTTGVIDAGDNLGANVGTVIRDSGTGNGSDGGFNVDGQYLAFQGTGTGGNNARFASLSPIDTSQVDTLTITAIVGNDVNGGEDPDLASECLVVMYKTPAMANAQFLLLKPDGSSGEGSGIIIPTPLSHNGGLNNYSISVPEYARAEGTQFVLLQNFNSGGGFDHFGVTKINFQRKAPMTVFVPLDNPEASSFIRGAEQGSTPKKRKKDINDKLEASDKYTGATFGNDFPGREVRVGGDDPFASAKIGDDVEPSPQSKAEVKKSFADFQKGDERVEVIKTPEQIKAQNDEYIADLENLLTQNEYDYTDPKIIEIADKILKTDPKSIDAYFYKLGTQYETGDMEGVLKTTDAMVKNNPDDPIGYEMRSFIKRDEGDLAGAIEDLEKAIELDPESEYVAYNEMELADLKFQEAEVEEDNATRDRIESEAGAIEAKAHEDYWDNGADLYEVEEPEIEPVEVSNWDKDESRSGILDLYKADYEIAKATIANLPKQSESIGATYGDEMDYIHLSQINTNIESRDVRFKPPESMSQKELQRNLISLSLEIEDQKYWVNNLNSKLGLDVTGAPGYVLGSGTKFTGEINGTTAKELSVEYDKLQDMLRPPYEGDWKAQNEKVNKLAYKRKADNEIKKLNAEQYQLITQYNKLYDAFMGVEGGAPAEQPTTLYDQMKALYDEEDPDKEIKTELNELGFDKQYKDLMSAWDSADKFSKFITPLKNLSDALLGSKTAQDAKYENYKIAIAKSIMLNKPIRVNPDTIDPMLIKKLGDRITPNQILDYDEEQRYKTVQEKYVKASKAAGNYNPSLVYDYEVERMMSGEPVIPIVSEAVPYADENIYEDEFGRVFTNDGSIANNTFQADKGYHGFAQSYVTDIMGSNPLAGRGQAQYQIIVPPDGTEPYLLYKDHAYHNVKSDDKGEVPGFMNQGAAGFVNWLGNTAHARGDGQENTGGMAGYPPNIRGDVITQFRINLTDLPEDVQGAVYRHPLMTEQPELTQFLKDTFYAEKWIKNIGGSKGLHDAYMVAIKTGDKLKDWVVDNGIELLAGKYKSASNLLQKYDDFIQQTVHTPDGKTYVPGYIDADGNVLQRVDVTDSFKKEDQNHLKNMINNDEGIQKILKGYLDGKNKKTELAFQLSTKISNLMNKEHSDYRDVFANSLGKSTSIDVDQFLKGKIVLKKGFEFREKTVDANWFVKSVAAIIDVNPDAVAASNNPLISLVTMTAARQLLHPVRGPATDWRKNLGHKQTFAQAMESAPQMPYKLEFDLSEKMMEILQGIEDEDKPKDDTSKDRVIDGRFVPAGFPDPRTNPDDYYQSNLGSVGDIGGVDATAAATAAAERRKKKKGKVNESKLFERLKKRPFFNQDDIKPEFPENPPPKLDPKTGMHPQYGKKASRFKKLDPISANSMPPTGDPEIDAVVNKQKTINKIKKMARKNLKESDFTNITKGNKVGQTFQHTSGATITIDNTMSDPSDSPSQVTLDLGFGEKITVDAPSQNQFGITGVTKRLGITTSESGTGGGGGGETEFDKVKELDQKVMQKQSAKTATEINQQLDASEKASGAETAKVEVEKPKFRFGIDDPTMPGVMDRKDEIEKNEKLYAYQKKYSDISNKNEAIKSEFGKTKVDPLAEKMLRGLGLKTTGGISPVQQLYNDRTVANEENTKRVSIDIDTVKGKTKIVFTRYTYNENTGAWSKSESSLDYPELLELPKMSKDVAMWASQSIDPKGAITRPAGAALAKVGRVESAFNLVNYYIDNHVKTYAGYDPARANIRHNVTDIFDNKTKDILRKGMDGLKPKIDEAIKLGKLTKESNADLQKRIRDMVDNYFAHGGAGKSSRDIFNSLGNALGFNLDTYMNTGNYQFDSTYLFTSTLDMGIRGKLAFLSGASQKYVSGQLYGETGMAVQNPMQFQVDIESGRQYSDIKNRRGRTIAPADPEPTKAVETKPTTKQTRRGNMGSDVFDRDDVSFKKKKKEKVNESNTFSKLKKIRNK